MSRAFDRDRDGPRQRGYTHSWQREADEFRKTHPRCVGCDAMGLVHRTECIDHIIPHKGDKSLFWNKNNWQPSCNWHHTAIKPELERRWFDRKITTSELVLSSSTAVRISRERYKPGVDVNGWPMAPKVSRETNRNDHGRK